MLPSLSRLSLANTGVLPSSLGVTGEDALAFSYHRVVQDAIAERTITHTADGRDDRQRTPHDDERKVVPPAPVPSTLAGLWDWLEGKERGGQPGSDGAALCRDLKELLWRDLDRFIRGYWDDATGAQVAGLGVKGVVTALAERARQLSSVPGKGQEAMAQQAQGEALKILAKQLMPKGERPSFLKT